VVAESRAKVAAKAASGAAPVVEFEIGRAHVWVWRGAEATMVTAIIGALKAAK
jgi:transposase